MIVWGGCELSGTYVNTGGRYDPATNAWTPTSTTGAPTARGSHTAVWTGTRMIVWGGYDQATDSYINTGARYNPATDIWTPTSNSGAPTGRGQHTAIWAGSRMIVWGGLNMSDPYLRTGGRYYPATDTWAPTSTAGAPTERSDHTAVWTGTKMIVWGGNYVSTGGRYSPTSDSWAATSETAAPTGNYAHTAIWTGTEMIVWGGYDKTTLTKYAKTGGRYNPVTDTWIPTSTSGAPAARAYHTAVWTGTEMIVWGGSNGPGPYVNLRSGGRYNPATDTWTVTLTTGAPAARRYHTAIWTGTEMIVWGGMNESPPPITICLRSGGCYTP